MRVLYYDCFSGISGDMNLGAMLELGVEKDYLVNELKKLKLAGWEMKVVQDQRHGITGTRVTINITGEEHHHRHLSDIEDIINKSSLNKHVKDLALAIFRKVAEAEAKVHNMPIEKVHFHEVGAIDSIIDITGAAICFDKLEIDKVIISPPELGAGFVTCAHGVLPVPAPATVEILKGIPVKSGNVDFEATTPTGAAIISTLGTEYNSKMDFRIVKTAYGIGQKENPSLPNLLRVYLGNYDDNITEGHTAYLIECNIDDMNPEMYEHLISRLFEAGAADVFLNNIIMKKSRPGVKVSIISQPGNLESIKEVLYRESTTIGLRIISFDKQTLSRKSKKIDTPFGKVTVKYAYHNNELVSVKPEISECKKLAVENKLSLKDVYNTIISIIHGRKE